MNFVVKIKSCAPRSHWEPSEPRAARIRACAPPSHDPTGRAGAKKILAAAAASKKESTEAARDDPTDAPMIKALNATLVDVIERRQRHPRQTSAAGRGGTGRALGQKIQSDESRYCGMD